MRTVIISQTGCTRLGYDDSRGKESYKLNLWSEELPLDCWVMINLSPSDCSDVCALMGNIRSKQTSHNIIKPLGETDGSIMVAADCSELKLML